MAKKDTGRIENNVRNYFKRKWLNFPTKVQKMEEWIKNTIQLYALYKGLNLDPKTHIG